MSSKAEYAKHKNDEVFIQSRLFPLLPEFKEMVVKECHQDIVEAEKYFVDLIIARTVGELRRLATHRPLAAMLVSKMYEVAKSGPYQLGADEVWQVFRDNFFGHGSYRDAEILARRLLWKMALTLEAFDDAPDNRLETPGEPRYGLDEQRDIITYFANFSHLENLHASILHPEIAKSLVAVFAENSGFKDKKIDAPNNRAIEAWYRFRRLIRKYRSSLYSAS